jgi:cytochrome b subunit of formate dehydrogenase
MSTMTADAQKTYERFSVEQRFEHVLMLASFTVLAVTGLPQKFIGSAVSVAIIQMLGGIEITRQIHHIAAIVMILSSVYHLAAGGYRTYVVRHRMNMLPGLSDLRDAINTLLYNLGVRKERVQFGRYNFEEKAEYWAFVWGTAVMVFTGFIMWNPIAAATFMPGQVIPAAKAAHGGEAVLAVSAIILWHMYGVHLRHFNKSMFTGKLTEHEMIDEHPLELADIKAGVGRPPVDPEAYARRRRLYLPVAAVVTVVLFAVVLSFMTFEQTALDTVIRKEPLQAFIPLTPTPFPTPLATATNFPLQPIWNFNISSVFQAKCADCHSTDGIAGLDLTTYAGVMQGSNDGPVIIPGDPDHSLLVIKQSAKHPGQLSEFELKIVKDWIKAGAPRQ